MNNKPLCIYHGNCADGFGAALAVWDAYGSHYAYVPASYGKEAELEPHYVGAEEILFVDWCPKRDALERLIAQGTRVTVLDHHKTARDAVEPLLKAGKVAGEFDMERSGAMITWQALHSGEPPALIKHIQDRDLFTFKLDGTREIQQALFSYPYDFAVWQSFLNDIAIARLREEGEAILRKHFKDIHEFIAAGFVQRVNIAGFDVPIINVPYTMGSDTCHLLCDGEPFAAYYYDAGELRQFGLRSTDAGEDVGEIAKRFGGGGHRNASGFSAPLKSLKASLSFLSNPEAWSCYR